MNDEHARPAIPAPTLGQIVHYTTANLTVVPAIVTRLWIGDDKRGQLGLVVYDSYHEPCGSFLAHDVTYGAANATNTWHWPEGRSTEQIVAEIETTTESLKDMNALEDAYTDRNLLAELVAVMAYNLGWRAGYTTDSKEPDWPVLVIETPAGQISYHMKADDLVLGHGAFSPGVRWDGHATDEKRWRIERLIRFLRQKGRTSDGQWIEQRLP